MEGVEEKTLQEKINEKYEKALDCDENARAQVDKSIRYIINMSNRKDYVKNDAVEYIIKCLQELDWEEQYLSLSILGAGSSGIIFNFENHSKDKHYVLKVGYDSVKDDQKWNKREDVRLAVTTKDGIIIENNDNALLMENGGPTLGDYLKDDRFGQESKYKAIALALRKMPLDHHDTKPENIFYNPTNFKVTYFDPAATDMHKSLYNINHALFFIPLDGGTGSIDFASKCNLFEDFTGSGFSAIKERFDILVKPYCTKKDDGYHSNFLKESIAKCYESSTNEEDLKCELNELQIKYKFFILKTHLESIYKVLLDSDSDSDSDDYSPFSGVISDEDYIIFCNKYLKDEEILNTVLKFFQDEDGKIHGAAEADGTINKKDMINELLNKSKNIEKKNTAIRGAITAISILLFPLLLFKKGHGMAKSFKRIRTLSPELSFLQVGIMSFKSSHCLQFCSRSNSETRVTALLDCLDRGINDNNTKSENSHR